MERKKRTVNWIDILFAVVILAVVLGAYLLVHRGEGDSAPEKRSYVIELTELEDTMADAVTVGSRVQDNVKNYDMGGVTGVEVIPAVAEALCEETGIVQETPIPEKNTLLVTVEAETLETEKDITTTSGYVLKVGTSVSCTIGNLTASGYIIELER